MISLADPVVRGVSAVIRVVSSMGFVQPRGMEICRSPLSDVNIPESFQHEPGILDQHWGRTHDDLTTSEEPWARWQSVKAQDDGRIIAYRA